MKVLLASPPFIDNYNQAGCLKKDTFSPPLGLGYLAAMLEEKCCAAKIVDFMHMSIDEAVASTLSYEPDVVGISCFTEQRSSAFQLVETIKQHDKAIKIVLGGSHATMLDMQLMQHFPIDAIVRGEGEITFLELLKTWKSNTELSDVQGLTYRDKYGNIIRNAVRMPIENLDLLPFPKYDYFDWSMYTQPYLEFRGQDVNQLRWTSLITTRGCPYRCQYCSTSQFWGKKYRVNSAEVVLKHVELLHLKHGVEFISFVDDEFVADKQRLIKICQGLVERNIDVGWTCGTRVDSVDQEVLSWMKKAGCIHICYGIESGSEAILRAINKRITPSDIRKAAELSHEAGIRFSLGLMIGNPGETKQTVDETIELLHEVKPHGGAAFLTTVFPGTDLHESYKSHELIDDSYWLGQKAAPIYDAENCVDELDTWAKKINFHLMTIFCTHNLEFGIINRLPVLVIGNNQTEQMEDLLKMLSFEFKEAPLTVLCLPGSKVALEEKIAGFRALTIVAPPNPAELYHKAYKILVKQYFGLVVFFDYPDLEEFNLAQLLMLCKKTRKILSCMSNGVLVELPKTRLLRMWMARRFVPRVVRESQFAAYMRSLIW